MFYPLTVRDFLDRAETVYPDRIAVVDEPDQPADSWGEITYAEMARRARAQAATLDEMGVPVGGRVAIVSHNSARLPHVLLRRQRLGPGAGAGQLPAAVPEVRYIVEHSGAEVLMVDPALKHLVDEIDCKRTVRARRGRRQIWGSTAEPRAVGRATRPPPPRSTTRPAPRRGPRASS